MTPFLIIIGLFILISIVEFVLIYIKWAELQDLHSVGKIVTPIIGVDEKYNSAINWITGKLINMKKFIWIPITIILVVNFLASTVVVTVFYFVFFIVSKFL